MRAAGALGPEEVRPDTTPERLRTFLILVRAGMGLLTVAATASVALRPTHWAGHLPYLAMLAAHAAVHELARRGHLRLAVAVHAGLYLAVVGGDLWLSGGVQSPAGYVLPPIVLVVGLTWSGRAAVLTAALASGLLLAFVVLGEAGQLGPPVPLRPLRLWVVASVTLAITGVVLAVSLRILAEARDRALDEERRRRGLLADLERAQRTELVARLSAGVAHDFNNVLTVVRLQAEVLSRAGDLATREAAREIESEATRAAGLVRQLLAVGRKQEALPRDVDLGESVERVLPLVRRVVDAHHELVVEHGEPPALARVDPGHLEQVALNLVTNAIDAMPSGGRVTIRTRGATPAEAARIAGEWTGGPAALLQVEDTGDGMAPEVAARVFEPFFTTKLPGKGTGLGLAVVHAIAEQAGGAVAVATRPGAGTTFSVVLPAAGAAA
ncbi:MAG: hypothetical protein IT376_07775 [Polyangiaceae bacterium]|nr:hypothetical protein [Polyangiaceae bacterium]